MPFTAGNGQSNESALRRLESLRQQLGNKTAEAIDQIGDAPAQPIVIGAAICDIQVNLFQDSRQGLDVLPEAA